MFSSRKSLVAVAFVATAALLAGTFAIADDKPANGKGQPEMKIPGMDPAHMQACMEAGMPGKNHAWLQKMCGTWKGKSQMWMTPEMTEPMNNECTQTITSLMDGKFIECTMKGEMAGMGPFTGRGTTGFDNVSKKFVSTWIDSCSTGIMNGTGELSADGKVMTWSYTANCPIQKKAVTMKMTETYNSPDSMTFVMYMNDFKTGKEFKHMQIELTRAK